MSASQQPLLATADAATERSDGVQFQRWLWAQQHPRDCRAAPGVLTRAGLRPDGSARRFAGDYFNGLGLGSQMASLKYNLLDALLKGRVYHFPTSHYVNPVRCPSQRFDCYFEPPTNCTLPPTLRETRRGGFAARASAISCSRR